jgi:hypothetical protein
MAFFVQSFGNALEIAVPRVMVFMSSTLYKVGADAGRDGVDYAARCNFNSTIYKQIPFLKIVPTKQALLVNRKIERENFN